MDVDTLSLPEYFRFFAKEVPSSPLYVAMCPILADNERAMAIVAKAQPMQRRPNLLLAAIHASLLRDPSHQLAEWFRTCGGNRSPDETELASAIESLLTERHDEILASVEVGGTQTNEPGRSALLLPTLASIARKQQRPLGLVEVGTSAALNLRLDSYQYTYQFADGELSVGDPNSPVHIRCNMTRSRERFDASIADMHIGSRVGVDLHPLDVHDEAQSRWLRALIWPDEVARFQRLAAAMELAKKVPVTVHQGDAVDTTSGLVDRVPANEHPVIITTWVLTYLPDDRRREFVDLIDHLGATRPLTWVCIEHPGYAAGLRFPPEVTTGVATSDGNPLVVSSYDGKGGLTQQLVGMTHPHGTWLNWFGDQGR